MSVSTRTSGIAPPCRAFRLRNALWLFGSLSNRERTDDLMRRPLLQPDRQSEVRAARAVRTDDHIGEFTGGVAETTHAANYRHRARIWVRPVGNQPRAVIEKMKPAGEKGRTLAGTNLRQSGPIVPRSIQLPILPGSFGSFACTPFGSVPAGNIFPLAMNPSPRPNCSKEIPPLKRNVRQSIATSYRFRNLRAGLGRSAVDDVSHTHNDETCSN